MTHGRSTRNVEVATTVSANKKKLNRIVKMDSTEFVFFSWDFFSAVLLSSFSLVILLVFLYVCMFFVSFIVHFRMELRLDFTMGF